MTGRFIVDEKGNESINASAAAVAAAAVSAIFNTAHLSLSPLMRYVVET